MKRKLPKTKLLADARAEMTEEEYFESKSFSEHLVAVFKFMTRCENNVTIHVKNMNNGMTAGTDGKILFLNWNNPIQKTFPTLKLKVQSVLGMFYHEVGHILYTDFDTTQDFKKRMKEEGKLSVRVEDILKDEWKDLEYFLEIRPEYRNYVLMIFSYILNVIEDIFMENKIVEEFSGTVKNAITINRIKVLDECPTLKRMIDNQFSKTAIMYNLILCYASSGMIPNPNHFQTVHTDALEMAKPYINKGISSDSVWERITQSVNVLLSMWQIIQEEIEEKEEEEKKQRIKNQNDGQDDQQSGGNNKSDLRNTVAERLSKKLEKKAIKSSAKNDEACTSEYYRGQKSEKQPEESRINSLKENGKISEMQDNSEQSNFEKAKCSEEQLPEEIQESRNTIRKKLENSPRFSETVGSADGDFDQGGKITFEDLEFSTNDGIGRKIAKSLEECAEETVNRKLLAKNQQELVSEVLDIPFTDNHKGVNFKVFRHIAINDEDIRNYAALKGVLKYSKALQNELKETLKKKPSGINTKQWIGKGLDKNNLYDKQKKVFYKKTIPEETNLAVSILIDESGSMGGRKLTEAVRMAVVLEDFCRNFKIPLSIAGHNWGDCVEYNIYKDFEDIDGNDKYRLMQITSKGCNRDGAALQFCGEHLLKRPEEKKLLILITDGQPNAGNYKGLMAKQDLRAIKKNLKNRGIELFAAAIDKDKKYIKAIYGDGFLDMSDLGKLPKTMVRLIENFMNI